MNRIFSVGSASNHVVISLVRTLTEKQKDHIFSMALSALFFLPFLFSNASHIGFEDIEYSFVPLFEWFYKLSVGNINPVNFLWEFGWQAPLAHGAWAFPGNLLLSFISAKQYFFLFYTLNFYISVYGFLGICRIYDSSKIYGVIAACLLSFLPPQGWYIFVHDAPSVLASIQVAPALIYVYLKLNGLKEFNEKGSKGIYYTFLLGTMGGYLINSGHPGMFYPFYAIPALAALYLAVNHHGSLMKSMQVLVVPLGMAILLSAPKLLAYWDVFSAQSSNLIERVVYDENPSRHDFFWLQSLLFPFKVLDTVNLERFDHFYFYLSRSTRYLPFLGVIFLFSIVISRKAFIYSITCLVLTVALQYLFVNGITLGGSGANHFFEGFMVSALVLSIALAPRHYPIALKTISFLCLVLLILMLMLLQQFAFKKYSTNFLNSTSTSSVPNKFLFGKKGEYGVLKGDRVLFSKKSETLVHNQKLRHRFVHGTSMSLDGINNLSMFGKGVTGEPIYPSFRQGYTMLTTERLLASLELGRSDNFELYLAALGVKGIVDVKKRLSEPWVMIDKKRKVAYREIRFSRSGYQDLEGVIDRPEGSCVEDLKCILKYSILLYDGSEMKLSNSSALFNLVESKGANFVVLPIRYHDSLSLVSNGQRDMNYSSCSGFVCLVMDENTENIKVTSNLTPRYVYLIFSVYMTMLILIALWVFSLFGPILINLKLSRNSYVH
ncbi:hypothetical protein VIOR3934_06419 [Vibrio orientalis CIP 102891 = ATCC 33934]|uniref:Uncharacterized protein n=1 Tax=Vibrio orientalis CIP 102891 = ATCC 33934 TaxID=675816 RepID=C9QDF2_VIBOR|nr:hypothetical protein [Vibrio orientalis]EEX95054.1 hypothetical protein VIA_000517 [Vibrio orientalis CIP 102891 = ATCC 33934]EGU52115.1 hypothetical protein VIOR3934_06419 [Vibrio orientalis CIP 102891 = ATCC 33934]